jgi:hypothetical protein
MFVCSDMQIYRFSWTHEDDNYYASTHHESAVDYAILHATKQPEHAVYSDGLTLHSGAIRTKCVLPINWHHLVKL